MKTRKLFILVIVIHALPIYVLYDECSGQRPSVGLIREFDSERYCIGERLIVCRDGDYLIIGNNCIHKWNVNDEFLWNSEAGGSSAIETMGGDYIVIRIDRESFQDNIYFFRARKIDSNGNEIWSKTLSEAGPVVSSRLTRVATIKQAGDRNYIVARCDSTEDRTINSSYLIKIDPDGKEIWSRSFASGRTTCMTPTSDGGCLVVGISSCSSPVSKMFLLKLDARGNKEWLKACDDIGCGGWPVSVVQVENGDYVIADFYGNIFQFEVNGSNCRQHWFISTRIVFGEIECLGSYRISYDSLRRTTDGGYIFAASYSCSAAHLYCNDWLVGKLDRNLNCAWLVFDTWEKECNGRDYIVACDVQETKDGGYLVVGLHSGGRGSHGFLCKIASDHVPPPPPPPPPVPRQLHYYSSTQTWQQLQPPYKEFNPTYPTVIIVHGFNPASETTLPSWTLDVTKEIYAKVPENKVNILAWNWQEEARGILAPLQVKKQGYWLSENLKTVFQATNYPREKSVQLMGHSLGTYVAIYAGFDLSQGRAPLANTHPPAQITLWDVPDRLVGLKFQEEIYHLRSAHNVYFDLYRGSLNTQDHNCDLWVNVPGFSHDIDWYRDTIKDAVNPKLFTSTGWFNKELMAGTLGFDTSSLSANDKPGQICPAGTWQTLTFAHPIWRSPLIKWEKDDFQLNGKICLPDLPAIDNGVTKLANGSFSGDGQSNRLTETKISFTTGSPITFILPIAIEPIWDYVSFNYQFVTAPSAAELTFSIRQPATEETVICFLMSSQAVANSGWLNSGLIGIAEWQGENVELVWELKSEAPGVTVEIEQLVFWTDGAHFNQPPKADAGADRAILAEADGLTTVTLDASGTTDPDSPNLLYWWTLNDEFFIDGPTPTVELGPGGYIFGLIVRDEYDHLAGHISENSVIIEVENNFIRGETNRDGQLNIADPIYLLNYLFASGPLACLDAGDANDDANLNIADPIYLLNYLFANQAEPPPPFFHPGLDATPDLLGCNQ